MTTERRNLDDDLRNGYDSLARLGAVWTQCDCTLDSLTYASVTAVTPEMRDTYGIGDDALGLLVYIGKDGPAHLGLGQKEFEKLATAIFTTDERRRRAEAAERNVYALIVRAEEQAANVVSE